MNFLGPPPPVGNCEMLDETESEENPGISIATLHSDSYIRSIVLELRSTKEEIDVRHGSSYLGKCSLTQRMGYFHYMLITSGV